MPGAVEELAFTFLPLCAGIELASSDVFLGCHFGIPRMGIEFCCHGFCVLHHGFLPRVRGLNHTTGAKIFKLISMPSVYEDYIWCASDYLLNREFIPHIRGLHLADKKNKRISRICLFPQTGIE